MIMISPLSIATTPVGLHALPPPAKLTYHTLPICMHGNNPMGLKLGVIMIQCVRTSVPDQTFFITDLMEKEAVSACKTRDLHAAYSMGLLR